MTKAWTKRGRLHRLDGPAMIDDISEAWYKNGVRHRLDGPALIYYDSHEIWFKNGKIHRTDGPAIVYYHFMELNKWAVDNIVVITVKEFCKKAGLSEEAALLLVLKYGGLTV